MKPKDAPLPRTPPAAVACLVCLAGLTGCFSSSGPGTGDSGVYVPPDGAMPDASTPDGEVESSVLADGSPDANAPEAAAEAGLPEAALDATLPDGASEAGTPDAGAEASTSDGGGGAARYVDVTSGLDTSPTCSQVAPCKTVRKAMTGAPSGSVVYLADGTYGTATQGSGVTIPDGVTLKAINPGGATLTYMTLTATGSATVDGVVFDQENGSCSSIAASASTATPTLALNGVLIKCMGAVTIGGTVHATMTPGALAGGVYTSALPNSYGPMVSVGGTATLLISGGVIDGNNVGSPAFGGGLLVAAGSSALTLDGMTLRNWKGVGIAVSQSPSLVMRNGTLVDTVGTAGNCPTASAIVVSGTGSVTVDHSQLSNLAAGGICVRNGTSASTIQVVSSTIDKAGAGIVSETGTGSVAVVTVTGSNLTGSTYGIQWDAVVGTTFDVEGTTITGNQTGLSFNAAGSLRLRGSNVSNNTATGVAVFATATCDLGTTADPGLNTFTGNTTRGLEDNVTSGVVQAVGNTWNASVQGADAAGHYSTSPSYTAVPQTGPVGTGTNFTIANSVALNL